MGLIGSARISSCVSRRELQLMRARVPGETDCRSEWTGGVLCAAPNSAIDAEFACGELFSMLLRISRFGRQWKPVSQKRSVGRLRCQAQSISDWPRSSPEGREINAFAAMLHGPSAAAVAEPWKLSTVDL